MGGLSRLRKKSAVSTVLGVVISVSIVLSVVAIVVTWGIPYIEYYHVKEAKKRATLQFDTINSIFNVMAYQRNGVASNSKIYVDKYSSIYSKENSDRMVIICSLRKDYNFSIEDIDPPSPDYKDKNLTIIMHNGTITHAWVYGLKDSTELYSPCFSSDTLILMWDGTLKPIEKIRVGDEVVGYNIRERKIEKGEVTDIRTYRVDSLIVIDNQLRVTENHLFYTEKGWVPASELEPGTNLLSLSGEWISIHDIRKVNTSEYVYDLAVSKCQNFFVMLDGKQILVHNQIGQALRCTLSADPSSGSAPLDVTFTINIWGGDPDGGNWSLSYGDGEYSGRIEYSYKSGEPYESTISHKYKSKGTYSATLYVVDRSGKNTQNTTTITVTGGEPSPRLAFSPETMDLGAIIHGKIASTKFYIWNNDTSGKTTLSFQLSSYQPWIDIYPSSGKSSSPSDKVTIGVSINTSMLSSGMEYTGVVYISSNGGDGYFTVNFTVVKTPIDVILPREGERFRVGEVIRIKWANISDIGNKVNITLCDRDGNPLSYVDNPIGKNIPTSKHQYVWKIPIDFFSTVKPYIQATLNISDGTGNYTLSSPFFIIERFDGIQWSKNITATSSGHNRYEIKTENRLCGAVVMELYNSTDLFGRIWIIDTDAVIYETSVSSGKYRCIAEFGGIVYDDNGYSYVYKPFLFAYINTTLGIVIDQIRVLSPFSVGGSTKSNIDTYLGIASQREETTIYNISISFYGTYAEAWNRYLSKNHPTLCSYHKDGLKFIFQHAMIRCEMGV